MNKNKVKKILAINFGGIGDEVLFFPTLKTLKSTFENANLTLVLEPRSKSVKELTNLVDEVITCDIKSNNKYSELFKFLLKAWSGRYDLVVSSGSSKMVALLLFLTGIKQRYGYNSGKISEILLTEAITLKQQQYAVKMYHDLTKKIAPDAHCGLPDVNVNPKSLVWASELVGKRDKKIVLIHPGVSQMSINKNIYKFWDSENWIELIKRLVETNKYRVMISGGPDDKSIIEKIRSELDKNDNIIDVYGKTTNISQLAALVRVSDLVICVDSAPMHIAVGTRTKAVALFGPTDEKKLLPSSDPRFVAVKNKQAPCRPCLWDKRQVSCDNKECLNISVDEVFTQVESFLQ